MIAPFPSVLVEFVSQENVLVGVVSEHQRDFRLVLWISKDGLRELVDGRDAGAASDQDDMGVLVRLPGVCWEGASGGDGVAGLEGVEVLAGFAAGVALDHKFDVAWLSCFGERKGREGARGVAYLDLRLECMV